MDSFYELKETNIEVFLFSFLSFSYRFTFKGRDTDTAKTCTSQSVEYQKLNFFNFYRQPLVDLLCAKRSRVNVGTYFAYILCMKEVGGRSLHMNGESRRSKPRMLNELNSIFGLFSS